MAEDNNDDPVYFFVAHEITDPDAWGEIYHIIVEKCKSPFVDIIADNFWGGYEPIMSVSSDDGDYSCCVWRSKPGSNIESFSSFINNLTGRAATNSPAPIQMQIGAAAMCGGAWINDIKRMTKYGHALAYAGGEGQLYCVRQHIQKRVEYAAFNAKNALIAQHSKTKDELLEGWKVPAGCYPLFTAYLSGDLGAMCIWECPKKFNLVDFQSMIDGLTHDLTENTPVFKVNHATLINGRLLHFDFYFHEAVVAAQSTPRPTM